MSFGGAQFPGGSGGSCGLIFSPTTLSFTVPTNDTGSVAQTVTVTSVIAQSVTFCAYWVDGGSANPCTLGNSPDPCISVPTVYPSTFTFTAGQSTTIAISVPYAACTVNGLTGALALGATTSLGCTVNNALTGGGTVTTSNIPTFAIETSSDAVSWATVATKSSEVFSGPCVCTSQGGNLCAATGPFYFRARSINGFAGTITLICSSAECADCNLNVYNNCVAFPSSVTLSAGETKAIGSSFAIVVQCYTVQHGGSYSSTNSLLCAGTSDGITKQAISESNIFTTCS